MRLYRVHQRVVISTNILIEADTEQEADEWAADFVEETIIKAILEESGDTDEVTIEDIEVTGISEGE